ncbi:MAG: FAD-binding oxidoreductase [Paludibacteraceae bacterium]|nr:FAD-binding oxidoreductase [Paludibacteraceae bacterium]
MIDIPGFRGKILTDRLTRILYSTDASAYCEMPLGVAFPCDHDDIVALVRYADSHKIPIIPRAAGTSIAGQVVGEGLVVDIRNLNRIIEINTEERWVSVEPAVVRDELNIALKPYGLFFSPETSTSNRCMVGGMVGNNSCGTHSLRYGSTRDHLISANVILSNGETVTFCHKTQDEVAKTKKNDTLESRIYSYLDDLLSDKDNQKTIDSSFPDKSLRRRNNGYALDLVRDTDGGMNLCKLFCGSEGTIGIATELKLSLDPLPPVHNALVCVHCRTLESSFRANLIAIRHHATAVELIDDNILNLSAENLSQRENRFFLQGSPAAILCAEFACDGEDELNATVNALIDDIKTSVPECYAFPVLRGNDIRRVWDLRKAGLGLLSNMPGDDKPAPVIEDTAVVPELLADYVAEMKGMFAELGLSCVFYAHIGSGELHLRPILNLKTDEGRRLFREVATRTAHIVRKYRGSLSGEHGDGRLRGEFIPLMYGGEVYSWFSDIKSLCDPNNILNPGKIVDTKPMDEYLRFANNAELNSVTTTFAFNGHHEGLHYIREIEKCNGAADCRKSLLFDNVMCPQFKTTLDERDSTRGRANILRTSLTKNGSQGFSDPDVLSLLGTCLSCKGCMRECPSSVDMTKIKAEYLQQHYDRHHVPMRTFLIGFMPELEHIAASTIPHLYNAILGTGIVHRFMGFDRRRTLPRISRAKLLTPTIIAEKNVILFIDEFTRHDEPQVANAFIRFAQSNNYNVIIAPIHNSGRTLLSQGLLHKAKKLAQRNIGKFKPLIKYGDSCHTSTRIVVLEPSALSAFRDDYRSLIDDPDYDNIQKNILLYDEWFAREQQAGHLPQKLKGKNTRTEVLFHSHCHQKAVANPQLTVRMLLSIEGVTVRHIPSTCCGMAGAYGYQHYERSTQIATPLIKAINNSSPDAVISAAGISCRTQIRDLTCRTPVHPVMLLP